MVKQFALNVEKEFDLYQTMREIHNDTYYFAQIIRACKLQEWPVKKFQVIKNIWMDRCLLARDYHWTAEDAVWLLKDICDHHFPMTKRESEKIITMASPSKCWEIGYFTEENTEQFRRMNYDKSWDAYIGIKYDYWTAFFAAYMSYLMMIEVSKIPFEFAELDEKYLTDL